MLVFRCWKGGETKVALISELCVVGTVVWYAGYKHVIVGERNHYFNGEIVFELV